MVTIYHVLIIAQSIACCHTRRLKVGPKYWRLKTTGLRWLNSHWTSITECKNVHFKQQISYTLLKSINNIYLQNSSDIYLKGVFVGSSSALWRSSAGPEEDESSEVWTEIKFSGGPPCISSRLRRTCSQRWSTFKTVWHSGELTGRSENRKKHSLLYLTAISLCYSITTISIISFIEEEQNLGCLYHQVRKCYLALHDFDKLRIISKSEKVMI